MEKKSLSDFNLDHFVYMSVGEHAGEPLPVIMKRKVEELESGMSLWAFSSNIVPTVLPLCNQWQDKNGYIYSLFINSGEPTKPSSIKMNYYIINGEKRKIPEGIKVTSTAKKAYALVVEDYYEVTEDNIINTGEYDSTYQVRSFGFRNKDNTKTTVKKYTLKK